MDSDKKNELKQQEHREFTDIDDDIKVVITFDGGGIRGLISLIIAAAIEKAAGVPLSQACDLIAGTSTGGIAALLLVLPDERNSKIPMYSANEIVQQYQDFAKTIFSIPLSRSVHTLWGLEKSKYHGHGIQGVMDQIFKKVLLTHALTRVMVVGAEIERYIPLLLKSYAEPNCSMKDAAIATSAAPTFFPVAKFAPLTLSGTPIIEQGDENYYVIDGKLTGVNNPSLLAYSEICDIYKDTKDIKEKVLVIAIGTGRIHRTIHYDEVAEGGLFTWMPFLLPLIAELASDITDYQMDILLKDLPTEKRGLFRRYWRLQPTIPEEFLMFDSFTDQKLKDVKNLTKNYVLEHQREINTIGKILANRARYLKKKEHDV